MVDHRREGRATCLGDDEDAAPGVGGIDIAPYLTGIDRGLHEPARSRLVDADRRGDVADRARAVIREHDEQPNRGVATATAGAAGSTASAMFGVRGVAVGVTAMGVTAERAVVPIVPRVLAAPAARPPIEGSRRAAERAGPERPTGATSAERTEGCLDRRDRVGT